MKIQEVLLLAMARKITWFQAAEILGFTDRHVCRIQERYQKFGYDGLFDRRLGKPSPKRVRCLLWGGYLPGFGPLSILRDDLGGG